MILIVRGGLEAMPHEGEGRGARGRAGRTQPFGEIWLRDPDGYNVVLASPDVSPSSVTPRQRASSF